MSLRNVSAWSIRNPIIPIVMFIGLVIAGLVSFNRMDINNSPDITASKLPLKSLTEGFNASFSFGQQVGTAT